MEITEEIETDIIKLRESAQKAFNDLANIKPSSPMRKNHWFHGRILAIQRYIQALETCFNQDLEGDTCNTENSSKL